MGRSQTARFWEAEGGGAVRVSGVPRHVREAAALLYAIPARPPCVARPLGTQLQRQITMATLADATRVHKLGQRGVLPRHGVAGPAAGLARVPQWHAPGWPPLPHARAGVPGGGRHIGDVRDSRSKALQLPTRVSRPQFSEASQAGRWGSGR